jgi:hypothetical protein
MREALTGLIEKAELAVAAASGVAPPEALSSVASAVDDIRVRLDYPDDSLVVALAGGTGSGKSSLFNVLAGTDVAVVGATRPTTSSPLAALPAARPGSFDGYLDRLGITTRMESFQLHHCLIDLPDTDSVEVEHRQLVEEIVPKVDVIVWVTDPEKYRDAALHDRYLRPLAGHGDRFVVVLNQIDRLDPMDLAPVVSDLGSALQDDGLGAVPIITTAALPGSGPPVGVESLRGVIDGMGATVLLAKLLADLEDAADRLLMAFGPPLDYRDRATVVTGEVVEKLLADDVMDASRLLTDFVDDLATTTAGPIGDDLRRIAAGIPAGLTPSSDPPPPPRRWWRRRPSSEHALSPHLWGDRQDEVRARGARQKAAAVLEPVEEVLTRRAGALAAVTDLKLTVATSRSRLGEMP